MADEVFTEPEGAADNWVDVRMIDPEKEEWDVDLVVVDGQVNYVDLRIKPGLLSGFVDCLVEDLSDEQARSMLERLAERNDIDLSAQSGDE